MSHSYQDGCFDVCNDVEAAPVVAQSLPAIVQRDILGFEKCPNRLLFNAEIPPTEKIVLLALLHYSRSGKNSTFVSQIVLAEKVGVGRARIAKAFAFLEREGFITAETTTKGRATSWVVNVTLWADLERPKTASSRSTTAELHRCVSNTADAEDDPFADEIGRNLAA